MAVTNITSFASGTVCANSSARLSAIHVTVPTDGTTGNTFLMVYDKATAPVGATDTPDIVWKVAVPSQEGNRGRFKFVLPGGGDRFSLGIGIFVATAFNGVTGATTTAPTAVDVFWEYA